MLAAAVGWPLYFLLSVPLYTLAVAMLVMTMRKSRRSGRAGEPADGLSGS